MWSGGQELWEMFFFRFDFSFGDAGGVLLIGCLVSRLGVRLEVGSWLKLSRRGVSFSWSDHERFPMSETWRELWLATL